MTQTLVRPMALIAALAAAAFVLAGCGKSPTPESTTPAADTAQADADKAAEEARAADEARAAELAAKEKELADREAELKQKELEAQLAQRDAANAAAAAEKQKAAAASKTAATKTAAKPAPKPAEPPKPIVVPAGTQLSIALDSAMTTKTANVDDPVTGKLSADVIVDGRKAAASGAAVSGKVIKSLSGSKKVGTTPKLGIEFTSLVAANGATVPISAKWSQSGKSEKGKDTAKIVGGAAAGAIIGNQISHDGGSVIGGVIGGAAGTAVAAKTGNEVEIAAGTVVTAPIAASFEVKPK